MSIRSRLAAAAVALALVCVSGARQAAEAQTSANAAAIATAFVVGVAPLTAATVQDLDFGSVNAGTIKTPTSLASDAARFNIAGEPSTPVTVSFVLPTVLTGAGSTTIPISFGGSDGLEWTAYPTTNVAFNPNAAYLTSLDALGNLVIGLSGTVSPPLGTTTGTYTGTITLTVTY
jgi:hypothetical protein